MDALFLCFVCGLCILSPSSRTITAGSPNGAKETERPPIVPSFQGLALKPEIPDKDSIDVPSVQYISGKTEEEFQNFFKKVASIRNDEKQNNGKKQNMINWLMKNKNNYWAKIQERRKYNQWLRQFTADSTCGQAEIPPVWPNFRVIGGRTSIPGSWPWMVSLLFDIIGEHWCAGTLISDQWIVTARHCFDYPFNDTRDWIVRLGKFDLSHEEDTEEQFAVKTIIGHPRYNPKNFDNDIALIQLDRPVEYTAFILPICLGSQHSQDSDDCVVTGWGKVSENSTHFSSVLRQVEIPVMKQRDCAELYGDKVTNNMMCAGLYRGGQDTCAGDSGGPLQCSANEKWFLQGITSWGGAHYVECGRQNQPGVYTRASHYRYWICRQIYTHTVGNGSK